MPCKYVRLSDGTTALVKFTNRAPRRCHVCHKPSTKLCDYLVVRNGRQVTCDKACCDEHSTHVGEDRDYCLEHTSEARAKGEL